MGKGREHLSENSRFSRELATLRRLQAMTDNQSEKSLARDIKLAVSKRIEEQKVTLSPDAATLLGKKAEALPDTIITLYLREVGAFSVGDFRGYLSNHVKIENPETYLREMGLWRMGADEQVPRPRIFPRSLIVSDLRCTTDMSRATAYRVLQLLAALKLTTESISGRNGALDVQVNIRLLELVEDAVHNLTENKNTRHRFDIYRISDNMIRRAFQMTLVLALGGVMAAPVRASLSENGLGVTQAPPVQSIIDIKEKTIECAAISDVLLGSSKLLGPEPRPAPIETLN